MDTPTHASGTGPVVCLDEAHHNFHTLDGRFLVFGRLLQADGYRVQALREAFTAETLAGCDLLVSANALAGDPHGDGPPPLSHARGVH